MTERMKTCENSPHTHTHTHTIPRIKNAMQKGKAVRVKATFRKMGWKNLLTTKRKTQRK
jgi:hypothetical protein